MRRPTYLAVAVTGVTASVVLAALAAAPSLGAAPSGSASTSSVTATATAAAAPARVSTKFALGASGFGTRVLGGSVPASSDATAYQSIGCTSFVGEDRANTEADVTVPGLGTLSGVKTRVWTEKVGSTVSSYSTQSIAKLTLVDNPIGVLDIRGIQSMSRAFNKDGRFGAQTEGTIARITFTPTGGSPRELDIPTPDQALEIPGLARIAVGNVSKKVRANGARAAANVLQIDVVPTDTESRVAQTIAKIDGGITNGVFAGFSAGLSARGLGDNVRVGRTPLSIMPCQGTQPKVKDTARIDLDDQIVARGVASGQLGTQARTRTFGIERAQAAQISLFDGQVQINGIVGVANVSRSGGKLTANTRGTHVLEVIANGESYEFPKFGALEIPGLVKLQDKLTTRLKNGVKVVALRITLLDGSAATIDVGTAQLEIRPGGNR